MPTLAWLGLLLLALVLPTPAPAGGLGEVNRQVLLEATILSVEYLDEMQLALEPFGPKDPIDPVTEGALLGLLDLAQTQTQVVIGGIVADAAFFATPDAAPALERAALSLDQMAGIDLLLNGPKAAKARKLDDAVQEAVNLQVAMLTAIQGRPERFVLGKHLDDEACPYFGKLGSVLERLADNGIPFDRTAFFETFVARGKVALALERIGIVPDPGVRVDLKGGVLGLRGDSKLPQTGGVTLYQNLPTEFTLLVSFRLPDKLSKKTIASLADYSVGLYLASESGPTPAASFVVEHQAQPLGFGQTFTAQILIPGGTTIVDTFPHAVPSLERRLRTFAVKDADSIRLGVLYRDGDVETLHESDIPYLGSLSVASFFFRNGTKKTRIEVDNLLILVEPHVILPEL